MDILQTVRIAIIGRRNASRAVGGVMTHPQAVSQFVGDGTRQGCRDFSDLLRPWFERLQEIVEIGRVDLLCFRTRITKIDRGRTVSAGTRGRCAHIDPFAVSSRIGEVKIDHEISVDRLQ